MADAKANKKPKLYYTSTSCGVASFIAAHKAGIAIDTEQVDIKTHKTDGNVDFYTINNKGNVPTIVLPDGTVLNENVATLSWIADQNLSAGLAPANGTKERAVLLNTLAWIASELHPNIGGLFNPTITAEVKAFIKARGDQKLTYLDKHLLAGRQFLIGDGLTVADLYGHIVVGWTAYTGVDISGFANVVAWMKRIKEHPDVVAAQKVVAAKPASLPAK